MSEQCDTTRTTRAGKRMYGKRRNRVRCDEGKASFELGIHVPLLQASDNVKSDISSALHVVEMLLGLGAIVLDCGLDCLDGRRRPEPA